MLLQTLVRHRYWYPVHTQHWSKSLMTSTPVLTQILRGIISNGFRGFYSTSLRWAFCILSLVPILDHRRNIAFAVTVSLTIAAILTNHLVFSFSRLLYPQLKQIIQALLSRGSSIMSSHHPSFLLQLPCHRHILDVLLPFRSPESLFIAERLAWILTMPPS